MSGGLRTAREAELSREAMLPPSLVILPQITVSSAGASPWAASLWSDEALDLLGTTPGQKCRNSGIRLS